MKKSQIREQDYQLEVQRSVNRLLDIEEAAKKRKEDKKLDKIKPKSEDLSPKLTSTHSNTLALSNFPDHCVPDRRNGFVGYSPNLNYRPGYGNYGYENLESSALDSKTNENFSTITVDCEHAELNSMSTHTKHKTLRKIRKTSYASYRKIRRREKMIKELKKSNKKEDKIKLKALKLGKITANDLLEGSSELDEMIKVDDENSEMYYHPGSDDSPSSKTSDSITTLRQGF